LKAFNNNDKFGDLIKEIVQQCERAKIKISRTDPKPKDKSCVKRIERALDKIFFENNSECNSITDMLRCSIIFFELHDVYESLSIINRILPGGILHQKDRFQKDKSTFKDVLINGKINGLVFEIQLHIEELYELQKQNHDIYEIIRLFDEKNNENVVKNFIEEYENEIRLLEYQDSETSNLGKQHPHRKCTKGSDEDRTMIYV